MSEEKKKYVRSAYSDTEPSDYLHIIMPHELKDRLKKHCQAEYIEVAPQVRKWIKDILDGKSVQI